MNSITNTEKKSNLFNQVEYATGHLGNRHIFREINEKIEPALNQELYRSHFVYTDDYEDYFNNHRDENGKKSTKGYGAVGKVAIDWLVIDIDDEHLSKAHTTTKTFIQALESNYELELNSLRINFSGSKGFHIRFPAKLFGDFEPSFGLPLLAKNIALRLSQGFIKIDPSVYDMTRLMRVVNSYNSKSGLYAIPLSTHDIFTMSIDVIKELAKKPRDLEYDDIEEYGPNENLINLKQDLEIPEDSNYKMEVEENDESSEDTGLGITKEKMTLSEALEPKESGERHHSLTVIYGHLAASKLKSEEIKKIIKYWNKQNIPPKDDNLLEEELKMLEKDYSNIVTDFWRIRRNKKNFTISIEITKFIDFLNNHGFAKIQFGKAFELIRVTENIASLQNSQNIKDFVFKHVNESVENSRHREKITDLMYDRVNKYFSEKLLETVNTIVLETKADTIKSSLLFYRNGILEVRKGEPPLMTTYSTLDKPIWESQVNNRDFTLINGKNKQSEFEKYLWNAMGKDENRMRSICSVVGYLLHRYKNRSNAKAIILMDEKISDVPVGRTGKSMLGKAISFMRESVRVDGKTFVFNDKFTFQQVNPSTEILEFNDVRKDFDFEKLFSVVTDDMSIEYKNKHPFQLQFEKSPKILVSTNFTIKGNGDSYRDRMFEIEFSNHYNADWKPIDEFGHLFFDEWNDEEWNLFDNFMVECLQFYLDEGLIIYKQINRDEKKLLMETSSDFLDFMGVSFVISLEYNKEDLFYEFKKHLGYESDIFEKCPVKKNTFTKYLRTYASYKKLNYKERNSNGKQFVLIDKQ